MERIVFAKFDLDSGCVYAWTGDCNLILIDCDAVEKARKVIRIGEEKKGNTLMLQRGVRM